MDLTKIKLPPWAAINIEIDSQKGQKYPARLVGFYPNRTVCISTPMIGQDRPLLLRKDQKVIVRFFANKIACAFIAPVVHVCTTPYHYFHLQYPAQVETGTIRKADRVPANISVSVINKTNPKIEKVSGSIVDISIVGARLETIKPVGKPGDKLVLNSKVSIGRVSRLVTWESEVKVTLDKLSMKNATAAYGLEFGHLKDLDYLALIAFVNTQLAKGLES